MSPGLTDGVRFGEPGGGRLVVPGMRFRLTMALLALFSAVVAVSGCGDDEATAANSDTAASEGGGDPATGVPGREPEVRGVVSKVTTDLGYGEYQLVDPSKSYYEDMSLLGGDPVIVDHETGDLLDVSDLEDGAEVEVWITGGCLESSPVQCAVAALRVSTSS